MPELPEVEVLVRHLAPVLQNRTIHKVHVQRPKVVAPTQPAELARVLRGATLGKLRRRGKYLVFTVRLREGRGTREVLGHLGMTGRMYLLPSGEPWPKHAAVVLDLGRQNFIFEDTRYFGRFTLDTRPIARLGPEPLEPEFTCEVFAAALARSTQAIKVKLLDQNLVAGIGNIYASEALFRARVYPWIRARRLKPGQVARLWRAIRQTLAEAIARGSTVPADHSGTGPREGLYFFGRGRDKTVFREERLRIYDREGEPCFRCGAPIRRRVQAARSTFYCPRCQRAGLKEQKVPRVEAKSIDAATVGL